MSITLIVTRSIDRNFNEVRKWIGLDEWLDFAKRDPELVQCTEPHVLELPDGQKMTWSQGVAEFDMIVENERCSFLSFFEGQLSTKFTRDLEDTNNPRRKKIAEIAKKLNALITHDAGDEILDW